MQGPLFEGRTVLEAVQKATGRRERLALRRKMRGDVDVFADPKCNQILRNLRDAERELSELNAREARIKPVLLQLARKLDRIEDTTVDRITIRTIAAASKAISSAVRRSLSGTISGLFDAVQILEDIAHLRDADAVRLDLIDARTELFDIQQDRAAATSQKERAERALASHDCRL